MSKLLFASYGDALKLILTGSTTKPLDPEQRAIFSKMVARRLYTNKRKKKVARKRIPNVRSKTHKDEETGAREIMYCVPDVFLYMVEAFDDWGSMAPPLDLPYLRQMTNQLDEPEPVLMALRWLDRRRDLAELDRNAGGASRISGETQSDLRLRLEHELTEISEQIKKAKATDGMSLQDAANALAKKWKKDGLKKFSKRAIAKVLKNSGDWNDVSEATIERNIRKQW